MFITTSRKPSDKTRSFCRSLSGALNSRYENRGKMSFRDVLIKASSSGFKKIALVSQVKGNPSRIEIFNENGEILITLYISVGEINSSGKIEPHKLKFRSDISDLGNLLSKVLDLAEAPQDLNKNLLWVKKGKDKTSLEFYDKEGLIRDPKIYVRRFQ